AAALVLALRGGEAARRGVPALLAALWAWTGVAYHWVFFAAINPAARIAGVLFVVQAALLLWLGTWRGAIGFGRPRRAADMIVGLVLIGYAALLYPLLGRWAGHVWPAAPSFGVTPCPLTMVSFGLLLLARGRVPPALLAVPVLWSLVGGSAAVLLEVPQDWMLPVAGVAGTALLLRRRADALPKPAP
ncbi:DUF6064 family protein, partial [Falsiroseomonas oryzae]|uniref:DUF6064 family protein n=1 Tax=Falsiroseomonas oryzae TaxID=2766473 RepID=UPI0022EAF5B9